CLKFLIWQNKRHHYAMPGKGTPFNSTTGRAGGKKSKRKPFDTRVQDFLQKFTKKNGKNTKITYEDALLSMLMQESMKGNITAIREMFNRGYGQPKQPVAISGDEDSIPVQVTLQHRKEVTKQLKKRFNLDGKKKPEPKQITEKPKKEEKKAPTTTDHHEPGS
ncbi:hypothetical protein KAR91_74335, partial [Candidatus Pacearchaeota archaeon]|nr:hypothetical protein [Candidatus Pacearchaeota archaeon]